MKKCEHKDCDRKVHSGVYCNSHRMQFSRKGYTWEINKHKQPRFCNVPDCGKPHYAKGFCPKHYNVWNAAQPPEIPEDKCKEHGCQFKSIGRNLCHGHYTMAYWLNTYLEIQKYADETH